MGLALDEMPDILDSAAALARKDDDEVSVHTKFKDLEDDSAPCSAAQASGNVVSTRCLDAQSEVAVRATRGTHHRARRAAQPRGDERRALHDER